MAISSCLVYVKVLKEVLLVDMSSSYSDKATIMSLTAGDEGFQDMNYIGLINNYCQRKNLSFSYVLKDRCGPAHQPQ